MNGPISFNNFFFLHTRLPCCLVFNKTNVSSYGVVFLYIRGRFSLCSSIFNGKVNEIPTMDIRLVLVSTYIVHFHTHRFYNDKCFFFLFVYTIFNRRVLGSLTQWRICSSKMDMKWMVILIGHLPKLFLMRILHGKSR